MARRRIAPLSKTKADAAGTAARRYIAGQVQLPASELRQVAGRVAWWRALHAYPLSLVTPGVRNWVSQETEGPVVVAQRLKRFDRILQKLGRFSTMRLSQMEDIAGCRAVLLNPGEVDAVAARIRRKWDVRLESDYREDGKPDTGYRGLHIVVVRQERLVEVQLRTTGQQYWSEQVERTASVTGYRLKDGEGPGDLMEYFRIASTLTWQQENNVRLDPELQQRLSAVREQVRHFFQR